MFLGGKKVSVKLCWGFSWREWGGGERDVFPLLFGIDCFQLSVHRNTTAFINYWVQSRGNHPHLHQVRVYRLNKFNTTKKNLPNEHKKRFKSSSGTWMALLEIQTLKVETVYNLDHFQKDFTSGSQDNTRCVNNISSFILFHVYQIFVAYECASLSLCMCV